jgi:hypothetical protein
MFRSLFQDHLQGSSFALSAPTTHQLLASSYVCIGMWSYALCLYLYPVYLPVCCLVVNDQTAHRQVPEFATSTEVILVINSVRRRQSIQFCTQHNAVVSYEKMGH